MTTKSKWSVPWSSSVAMLCFGLAGCGGGAVSEKSARTAYEKSRSAITEGKAKLVSFRKINARQGELMGMKFYEVEYEAEVEFLEDFPARGIFRPVSGPTGKKGEIKKDSGWLQFEQTEKGWRGPDKNAY